MFLSFISYFSLQKNLDHWRRFVLISCLRAIQKKTVCGWRRMDSGNLFFYFCATSSGLTRTSVRLCVKLALLFGFCHDTCCPFHRKNTSWKCLLSRVIEFDKPGRVSILLLYNIQSKNDIYFDLASHVLFNSLIRSWNSGKDYQNTNE